MRNDENAELTIVEMPMNVARMWHEEVCKLRVDLDLRRTNRTQRTHLHSTQSLIKCLLSPNVDAAMCRLRTDTEPHSTQNA